MLMKPKAHCELILGHLRKLDNLNCFMLFSARTTQRLWPVRMPVLDGARKGMLFSAGVRRPHELCFSWHFAAVLRSSA